MRFTAVGHVTNDRLAGGVSAGGSALYAALTARALGADVHVITSHGPDFVGGALLAGFSVEVHPAARTTSFENHYDPVSGHRTGRLTALAAPLGRAAVVDGVVFICPIAGEADPIPGAGVGLQGWLRDAGPDGLVHLAPLVDARAFAGCRVGFVSAHDLGDDAPRAVPMLAEVIPILVVTHGAAGAEIHQGATRHRVAACPAAEVDPTGAGDVFATSFLIALARGASPIIAGRHAACAASVVVEGVGPSALSRLASELPRRLDWYNRHVPI